MFYEKESTQKEKGKHIYSATETVFAIKRINNDQLAKKFEKSPWLNSLGLD